MKTETNSTSSINLNHHTNNSIV